MRNVIVLLITALLLLVATAIARSAGRAEACALGDTPESRLAGTAGCLLLGAAAGLALHEGTHALVGAGDLDWSNFPRWRCPGCSAGRVQTIAMAPFLAQAIANEVLLDTPGAPRDHPIAAGFLLWGVLHPLTYVLRTELGGHGDFGNFHDSGQRRLAEGLVAGAALLQGARLLFFDERFPLLVESAGRDIRLVLRLTW